MSHVRWQVVNMSSSGSLAMNPLYQLLLEEVLRLMYQFARSAEINAQKPTSKFCRALLHKTYDVLDKVCNAQTSLNLNNK